MRFRHLLFAAALLMLLSQITVAQVGVRAVADRQQWYLDAGESTYVVGVNDGKMLQTLYWSPALPAGALLPPALSARERASFDASVNTTALEYPGWGAGLFTEPALKVDSPNGDRTLVLLFEGGKGHGFGA